MQNRLAHQLVAMSLIAPLQLAGIPARERSRQQAVKAFFQAGDLTLEARRGQLVPAMTEVDGRPEQVLQFVRPTQARAMIDQALQVVPTLSTCVRGDFNGPIGRVDQRTRHDRMAGLRAAAFPRLRRTIGFPVARGRLIESQAQAVTERRDD